MARHGRRIRTGSAKGGRVRSRRKVLEVAGLALIAGLGLMPISGDAADPAGPAISAQAAHAIATRYFAREIAVEGSVGEGVLRGEHWAFPAKFGVAGRAAPDPILVHATTGAVSWAGLADHRARVESLKRKPR